MWKLSYTIYKIKMRGIINQRQANNIYNVLRRNNYRSRITYSAKMQLKIWNKYKSRNNKKCYKKYMMKLWRSVYLREKPEITNRHLKKWNIWKWKAIIEIKNSMLGRTTYQTYLKRELMIWETCLKNLSGGPGKVKRVMENTERQ